MKLQYIKISFVKSPCQNINLAQSHSQKVSLKCVEDQSIMIKIKGVKKGSIFD